MANIARIDRKRLATTDERHPTKESPPELRAKRKRTSAAAEAPKAAPPKRRRTPALKAMPADPESTAAAPNAVSAAPGALKIASPPSHSDAGHCHPTDGSAAFRERFQTLRTSRGADAARPPRRRRRD